MPEALSLPKRWKKGRLWNNMVSETIDMTPEAVMWRYINGCEARSLTALARINELKARIARLKSGVRVLAIPQSNGRVVNKDE